MNSDLCMSPAWLPAAGHGTWHAGTHNVRQRFVRRKRTEACVEHWSNPCYTPYPGRLVETAAGRNRETVLQTYKRTRSLWTAVRGQSELPVGKSLIFSNLFLFGLSRKDRKRRRWQNQSDLAELYWKTFQNPNGWNRTVTPQREGKAWGQ